MSRNGGVGGSCPSRLYHPGMKSINLWEMWLTHLPAKGSSDRLFCSLSQVTLRAVNKVCVRSHWSCKHTQQGNLPILPSKVADAVGFLLEVCLHSNPRQIWQEATRGHFTSKSLRRLGDREMKVTLGLLNQVSDRSLTRRWECRLAQSLCKTVWQYLFHSQVGTSKNSPTYAQENTDKNIHISIVCNSEKLGEKTLLSNNRKMDK